MTVIEFMICNVGLCFVMGRSQNRGGGKPKKENSSPKNQLLLMNRGILSYPIKVPLFENELNGCTLIFTSLVFNSN
jgi:hypothetical protein